VSGQPPQPDHLEIQELLGAYALDAVDPETAALIEGHLEECVRCSIEVAQHHEVAGLLANSGGTSPADLWDGIARQLDGSAPPSWEGLAGRLETGGERPERVVGSPTVVPIARAGSPARRAGRVGVVAATVAAVAAAVVAIGLGVQVHHLDNQVNALSGRPSLTAAERVALASPTTKRVVLKAGTGGTTVPGGTTAPGRVTVVLTSSGTGFVEAGGLAGLPRHRTYQLWGVIGGKPISLGLLGSDPGVVPFSVAGGAVTVFAITDESAGGVVTSTNQPVVEGSVSA
jgi:hypothetical protein